jgi:hypothetical protein
MTMPDLIPEPVFDALMTRAGILLDPEGRSSVHAASGLLLAMIERLHAPLPIEVEPAPVFSPRDAVP